MSFPDAHIMLRYAYHRAYHRAYHCMICVRISYWKHRTLTDNSELKQSKYRISFTTKKICHRHMAAGFCTNSISRRYCSVCSLILKCSARICDCRCFSSDRKDETSATPVCNETNKCIVDLLKMFVIGNLVQNPFFCDYNTFTSTCKHNDNGNPIDNRCN